MKKDNLQSEWLDIVDVMTMLRISRANGHLTAHRLPGCRKLYFRRSDIDHLLSINAIYDGKIDKTAFLKPDP